MAESLVRLGQRSRGKIPPVPCKVYGYWQVCMRHQLREAVFRHVADCVLLCTSQGLHKWIEIGMELRAAQVVTERSGYTEKKGKVIIC